MLIDDFGIKLTVDTEQKRFSILLKDIFSDKKFRKSFDFREFLELTKNCGFALNHTDFTSVVSGLSRNDAEISKQFSISISTTESAARIELSYTHLFGVTKIPIDVPKTVTFVRSPSEEYIKQSESTVELMIKQSLYILEHDLRNEIEKRFAELEKRVDSIPSISSTGTTPGTSSDPSPMIYSEHAFSSASSSESPSPNLVGESKSEEQVVSSIENKAQEPEEPEKAPEESTRKLSDTKPDTGTGDEPLKDIMRRSLSIMDIDSVYSKLNVKIFSGSSDGICAMYDYNKNTLLHSNKFVTTRLECLIANKSVISAAGLDGKLKIWESDSGEELHTIDGHFGPVWKMRFVGNKIATASSDRLIKLWDVENGSCIQTLSGHDNQVSTIQFKHDTFVSGSYDNSIKLWDLETGKEIFTMCGHEALVRDLDFDAWRLISVSDDKTLRTWDLRSGKCINTFPVSRVICLRLCDYGGLISCEDRIVRVIDLDYGDITVKFGGHQSKVESVDTSNDLIATGSWDSSIRIWDVVTGKCNHIITDNTDKVRTVKFLNDSILLSGSDDGTVRLFNTSSGECTNVLTHHRAPVRFLGYVLS